MRRRWLLAAVTTALLLGGCGRLGGSPFQATLNRPQPLSADHAVGQTFTPVGPVTGIDVHLATYGVQPDPSGTLEVVLREGADGQALATAAVPAADIGDARWARARFDRPVVVDGLAAFTVAWTGTTPAAAWVNALPPDIDGAVCAGDPPERLCNDPYPGGQLLIGGQPAQGDMAFRVTADVGPRDVLDTAVGLVRGAGSALLRQPLFGLGWAVLFVGALTLALAGFRGARTAPQLADRRPDEQQRQGEESRP